MPGHGILGIDWVVTARTVRVEVVGRVVRTWRANFLIDVRY